MDSKGNSAGKNVDISLEFQNPSSGQTLSHVNYNLKIIDPSGKTVKSIDGIHTHSGKDIRTVKLDKRGDFTLEIIVIGLGINKPFDTSKSGTAQTAMVVVRVSFYFSSFGHGICNRGNCSNVQTFQFA